MKKIISILFTALLLVACVNNKPQETSQQQKVTKIDFILDWVANTNHTGLFVAKEKGFLAEKNLDLDIKYPPNDSTSDLIINNRAPFGIYFQDSMSKKLAKGAGITAVAAIIEHNTLGLISEKSKAITDFKALTNHSFGTWQDKVELAMMKHLVNLQGGNFDEVSLVPNTDDNSITAIANGQFDSALIYYAWDKIMADELKIDTNFSYVTDADKNLDFYSPIIIANNDYLKNNPEQAKAVLQAIKQGYIYAAKHPEEAVDILIKYNPELKDRREFLVKSQKYLANKYADNIEKWGHIDPTRWANFFQFINEQNILDNKLDINSGFDNSFIDE